MRTPAVVGSWPEPFAQASTAGGRASAGDASSASAPTRPATRSPRRLERDRGGGRRARATTPGPRLLVGPWERVRERPGRRRSSSAGPAASGVFADFERSGGGFRLLGARPGRPTPSATLGPGAGLVAALRRGDEPPTWVVTGADAAGVARRPRLLDDEVAGGPLRPVARRTAARSRCPRAGAADEVAARLRAAPGTAAAAAGAPRRPSTSARSRWSPSPSRTRSCSPGSARPWSSRDCSPAPGAALRAAARWGLTLGDPGDRGQRDRLPARRHDPAPRRRAAGARPASTSAPRRWSRAAILALRIAVVLLRLRRPLGLRRPRPGAAPAAAARPPLGADRDPDHAAGAARRRRPRPAARGAARCAGPGGRAGRPRGARPAAGRRLARPRRRRRRDARAARLRARRARPRGPRAARSRHGWRFARRGRRDRSRSRSAPRSRASAASRPTRRSSIDADPATARARRGAAGARRAAVRRSLDRGRRRRG